MGGEAQASWSGSAGLNPAQTHTVILSQVSFPGWLWLGLARWDQRAGKHPRGQFCHVLGAPGKHSLELGTRVLALWSREQRCCGSPLLSPCAGQVETQTLSFHIPSVPSLHQRRGDGHQGCPVCVWSSRNSEMQDRAGSQSRK